jgi:nucleoside-diphosphate kinase
LDCIFTFRSPPVGKIVGRFEERGYKMVAMKAMVPTLARAEEHYADLSKKPFFGGLTKFLSSGPVVAMVWEGHNVVKGIRQMLGQTNPQDSLPGSIRGDYSISLGRNVIHASDSVESANHEIGMWFDKAELMEWAPVSAPWIYE